MQLQSSLIDFISLFCSFLLNLFFNSQVNYNFILNIESVTDEGAKKFSKPKSIMYIDTPENSDELTIRKISSNHLNIQEFPILNKTIIVDYFKINYH
jgi:hypothetical protein